MVQDQISIGSVHNRFCSSSPSSFMAMSLGRLATRMDCVDVALHLTDDVVSDLLLDSSLSDADVLDLVRSSSIFEKEMPSPASPCPPLDVAQRCSETHHLTGPDPACRSVEEESVQDRIVHDYMRRCHDREKGGPERALLEADAGKEYHGQAARQQQTPHPVRIHLA